MPGLHPGFPATLCRYRHDQEERARMAELTRYSDRPEPSAEFAARAAATLAGATAQEIVRWAADTFDDRLCLTSSMTDAVVIHLASLVQPGIDVLFLDTGYHFAETIGTRDAIATVYPVNVISVTPERTVAQQDAAFGPRLYQRDPDFCCQMRKVEPLE